jgi:hypothetical protein
MTRQINPINWKQTPEELEQRFKQEKHPERRKRVHTRIRVKISDSHENARCTEGTANLFNFNMFCTKIQKNPEIYVCSATGTASRYLYNVDLEMPNVAQIS